MESGPKQEKITSSITELATKYRPEESGGQLQESDDCMASSNHGMASRFRHLGTGLII
jgi:hypothetical protein